MQLLFTLNSLPGSAVYKVPNPHSFAMESVKICHFETFRVGNLHLEPFLHYIHVKKFVCEDILAKYDFESETFKGGNPI